MESIKHSFGRRLRAIRKARGFSREKLSQYVEIGPLNFYRIEKGQQWIAPETLEKVAEALEVSPAAFFTDDIAVIKPTPREAWEIVGEFIDVQLSKKKTDE